MDYDDFNRNAATEVLAESERILYMLLTELREHNQVLVCSWAASHYEDSSQHTAVQGDGMV